MVFIFNLYYIMYLKERETKNGERETTRNLYIMLVIKVLKMDKLVFIDINITDLRLQSGFD